MSDINFAAPVKKKKPLYANPILWTVVGVVVVGIIAVVVFTQVLPASSSSSSSKAAQSSNAAVSSSSAESSSKVASSDANSKFIDSNGKRGEEYFIDEDIKDAAASYGMDEQEMRNKINEINMLITDAEVAELTDKGASVDDARKELISIAVLQSAVPMKDDEITFDAQVTVFQPGVGIDVGDNLFISVNPTDKDGVYTIKYDNQGEKEQECDLSRWAALDKDKNELHSYGVGESVSPIAPGEEFEQEITLEGEVALVQFKGTQQIADVYWQVNGDK